MAAKNINRIKTAHVSVESIRNVCILAHVDHGKTTLADCLLASNHIVSKKLAGQLRMMDNLEEEQLRGITMKSSATSLFYVPDISTEATQDNLSDETIEKSTYLINVIDSPGHIDFSNEVSTAVRLADAALIVVDVVEGVCPQTRAVMYQGWHEGLTPILVLNKVDRLLLELRLSPEAAYSHLFQVIEHVNSILAELHAAKRLNEEDQAQSFSSSCAQNQTTPVDLHQEDLEHAEANLFFNPSRGNVIFASAWDSWGFRVHDFARIYADRLACREEVLRNTLWGDFYFHAAEKKIRPGAVAKQHTPLFVQLVLKQLWSLYESILGEAASFNPVSEVNESSKDEKLMQRLQQMLKSLKIDRTERELRSRDRRALLKSVMGQWLPLGRCVFQSLVEICPHPGHMSDTKLACLMKMAMTEGKLHSTSLQALALAIRQSSRSEDAPTMIFVPKFFLEQSCDLGSVDANGQMNRNSVIGFARIYSGRVVKGDKLFLLGPRYDRRKVSSHVSPSPESHTCGTVSHAPHAFVVQVAEVYHFFGRELLPADPSRGITAGHVLGLRLIWSDDPSGMSPNLNAAQYFKSVTLSSSLNVSTFAPLTVVCDPIVCVAVEPCHTSQLHQLETALQLLEQVDPSVKLCLARTGEMLLYAAGEVHLEKCLEDLRKRLAVGVEFTISPFIVPFRESILSCSEPITVNTLLSNATANLRIRLQAFPLPKRVLDFVEKWHEDLMHLQKSARRAKRARQEDLRPRLLQGLHEALCGFSVEDMDEEELERHRILLRALTGSQQQQPVLTQEKLSHNVWAVGPTSTHVATEGQSAAAEEEQAATFSSGACNLFLSSIPLSCAHTMLIPHAPDSTALSVVPAYVQACVDGFDLACRAGPLCQEPLRGVAFLLESVSLHPVLAASSRSGNAEEEEEDEELLDEATSPLQAVSLDDGLVQRFISQESQVPSEDKKDILKDEKMEDRESSISASEATSEVQHSHLGSSSHPGTQSTTAVSTEATKRWTSRRPQAGFGALFPCSPGQLTTAVRKACTQAFQASPHQRLVLAMYELDAQVREDVMGKLHAVLARRHANIFYHDIVAGTATFEIRCHVPVVESFGLCEELRKRTSGLALPQMRWSHWEVLDGDPTTDPPLSGLNTEDVDFDEEQRRLQQKKKVGGKEVGSEEQHHGTYTDWARAVRYYTEVRTRKGLLTRKQLVKCAEKQRNLSKKK